MENEEKKKTDVLGPTYQPGKPSRPEQWKTKLQDREEIVKYITVSESNYWHKSGK